MHAQTIRTALGQLQDDPDLSSAWEALIASVEADARRGARAPRRPRGMGGRAAALGSRTARGQGRRARGDADQRAHPRATRRAVRRRRRLAGCAPLSRAGSRGRRGVRGRRRERGQARPLEGSGRDLPGRGRAGPRRRLQELDVDAGRGDGAALRRRSGRADRPARLRLPAPSASSRPCVSTRPTCARPRCSSACCAKPSAGPTWCACSSASPIAPSSRKTGWKPAFAWRAPSSRGSRTPSGPPGPTSACCATARITPKPWRS